MTVVRFHLRRFEAWAISFTTLCPCLSEETLKAVGPNSCVSSILGCLEYNYLRLERPGSDHMIQLPALLTFLLLVIPSIIDHVQLDEVVVLAFWYQNSSKLIYIQTLNTLVVNPSVLKFQILLSLLISSVFIAFQDTQPISLKNTRICLNIWLLCIQILYFRNLDIPPAIKITFTIL